jgi:hypothetical protein
VIVIVMIVIDCQNEWLPIISMFQWFYINETLLFLLEYLFVEKRSNLSNTSLVRFRQKSVLNWPQNYFQLIIFEEKFIRIFSENDNK